MPRPLRKPFALAICLLALGSNAAADPSFLLYSPQAKILKIDPIGLLGLGPAPHQQAVELAPVHGSLVFDENQWVYTPDPSFFGSDFIRLVVEENFWQRHVVDVEVRVLPNEVPVGGDWDADGEDEVGLYDGVGRRFLLCGDRMAPESANLECDIRSVDGVGEGLLPVVGNWGQLGADQLALYNPVTGIVYRLGASGLCFRGCEGAGLQVVENLDFGRPGTFPVFGDWDGDGQDAIAFYDVAGTLSIFEDNTPEGPVSEVGGLVAMDGDLFVWPARWWQDQEEVLGLVDPARREFHWYSFAGPVSGEIALEAEFQGALIPMTGRWDWSLRLPLMLLAFGDFNDGIVGLSVGAPTAKHKPVTLPVKFPTDPDG